MSPNDDPNLAYFRSERNRHYRNAQARLKELKRHLDRVEAGLTSRGSDGKNLADAAKSPLNPTITGAFLNGAIWEALEHDLVRWWAMADAAATLELDSLYPPPDPVIGES